MKRFLYFQKNKPNLIDTGWGKEIYNNFMQNFLNNNNVKQYSRNTHLGAVFAERFNRTIRVLLKKDVFEGGVGNWIDVLQTITKQYNNQLHTSTALTSIKLL